MADHSFRERSSSPSTAQVTRHLTHTNGSYSVSALSGTPGAAASRAEALQRLTSGSPHDSAILKTIRKHTEAVEERLAARMAQAQNQQDRHRQATASRLEEKIAAMEALLPRLDRRVAELQGHVKGISDEMQLQIRRVDASDDRLWDCRHQMEEEFRGKLHELETHVHKLAANQKVQAGSVEDGNKRVQQRLQRLEHEVSMQGQIAEVQQDLLTLHDGLHALEVRMADVEKHDVEAEKQSTTMQLRVLSEEAKATWSLAQAKLADVAASVERSLQENRSSQEKIELHDEKLKVLRTRWDANEDRIREISEQVESVKLSRNRSLEAIDVQGSGLTMWSAVECAQRVQELERRMTKVCDDLSNLQVGDSKVNYLVGQLQELGPAVIDLAKRVEEVNSCQVLSDEGDSVLLNHSQTIELLAQKVEDLQCGRARSQSLSTVAATTSERSLTTWDPASPTAVDSEVAAAIAKLECDVKELHVEMQGKQAGASIEDVARKLGALEEEVRSPRARLPEVGLTIASVGLSAIKDELASSKADWLEAAASIAQVQAEVKELRQELQGTQAGGSIEAVERKLGALEEEVRSPKSRRPEVGLTMATVSLSAMRDELDVSRREWQEAAAGMAKMEADVKEIRAELQSAQAGSSIEAVERKLGALEEEVHSPRSRRPEVSVTMASVGMGAIKDDLAASKAEWQQAAANIAKIQADVKELRTDMQTAQAAGSIEAVERKLGALEEEVRSPTSRRPEVGLTMATVGLHAVKDDLAASKAEWQEAAANIVKIEADVKELRTELQSTQAGSSIDAVERKIGELEEEVRSPRSRRPEVGLTMAAVGLSAVKDDLAVSKAEWQQAAASISKVEANLQELWSTMRSMQELQAELQSKQAAETGSLGPAEDDDDLSGYDPEVNPALILDLTQETGKVEATEEEPRVTSPTTRAERLLARANQMDQRSAGAGRVQAPRRASADRRSEATAVLSTMRDDLASSKAKWQEAAASIGKLEADVKEQTAEVQSVQAAVTTAEGRIQALQEQMHGLQASKEEAAVAQDNSGLSTLREEVSHSQTEVKASLRGLQEELGVLAATVTGLQSAPTAEAEARRTSMAKLVQSLKEDEEVEGEAYTKLLSRIGDLCSKLEVVDAAVTAATHATEGDHNLNGAYAAILDEDGGSAVVATADLYQRLSTLAGRVEASENQAMQILTMLKQHVCASEAA